MLSPERPWGLVTELAETYHVSRKFLYSLRDKASTGLIMALYPQPPGPKPKEELEEVGQAFQEDECQTVEAFWEALSLFHRSSSLAESLYSRAGASPAPTTLFSSASRYA